MPCYKQSVPKQKAPFGIQTFTSGLCGFLVYRILSVFAEENVSFLYPMGELLQGNVEHRPVFLLAYCTSAFDTVDNQFHKNSFPNGRS
jgi:hypothetical protein